MRKTLEGYRQLGNWVDFAWLARRMKFIFLGKDVDTRGIEVWPGLLERLESYRRDQIWPEFATHAVNALALSPDRFADLNVDDRAWAGMHGLLDHYNARPSGSYAFFLSNLALLEAGHRL